MAVICIAGIAPGIGKTAVAELVLRELGGRPRWGWHAARVRMADEIPEAEVASERRIFEEKAREEGKPDNVIERIVDGQVAKWSREITLLDQEHVNTEKHESKTIEQLREELAAKVGENVVISRFTCYRIGE